MWMRELLILRDDDALTGASTGYGRGRGGRGPFPAKEWAGLRIPGEVARESGMMSPTIPI